MDVFKRACAGLLALASGLIGAWAQFQPRSFFDSFPAGTAWVSPLGPYNEHLVRDVGGLHLALMVLSLWAAAAANSGLFAATGAAWLAFGVPHLSGVRQSGVRNTSVSVSVREAATATA